MSESPIELLYSAAPVQQEFHQLKVDEALFGGSAGPGKSTALRSDCLDQVLIEHERCRLKQITWGQSDGRAIYFRRTMPRLRQAIKHAKMFYGSIPNAGFKWNEQTHTGTFKSGYEVIFGHMKDSDSFMDYRSSDYARIYFDELIEFEKDQYIEMTTRCRSTDPVLSKSLKILV